MDFVKAANQRYENLLNPERVLFHSLMSLQQSLALTSALEIFRTDWINADHLSELRSAVSKSFWFIRLPYFFSTAASAKLEELQSGIDNQVDVDKRFLGPEELNLLTRHSERIRELTLDTAPWEELATRIRAIGGNLLLATEQSRWSADLRDFAAELGRAASIVEVGSIGYLSKVQPANYDALVFLGSPLEISGAHSRLLFCSGLAPQLNCWIPGKTSFSSGKLESHAFGTLRPTVSLPGFKQESFENEPTQVKVDLEEISRRISFASPSRDFDLEGLALGGTESCLLLRIDDDSVIPIEEEAAKVSTLVMDEVTGLVKEEKIAWPFSGPGAIVFALVEQGEQDFLWEAAKVEMGVEFLDFSKIRDEWLGDLNTLVKNIGISQAARELSLAGVSTSSHLGAWIANDKFTRPRADSDFRALLEFLWSDKTKIDQVMRLTSKFRGELNQIAKAARALVCEALGPENWSDLQAGDNLDVLLEEFGDVVYRVGKVVEISKDPVLVSASQVRRVVRG
jgi:hypothetical protein